jgi:hypothetical protein
MGKFQSQNLNLSAVDKEAREMVALLAIAVSLIPLTLISLLLWLSSAEERWLERNEVISEGLQQEYLRNGTVAQETPYLVRDPVSLNEDEWAA